MSEDLRVLAGRWHTTGRTTDEPSLEVDAIDIYEPLPGGALLHRVDAKMGADHVEGAEIIGFDPAIGRYRTLWFAEGSASAYEAELTNENGLLVWSVSAERERFRSTFNDDRSVIAGTWERLTDDGNWQRWMDITLTRTASI